MSSRDTSIDCRQQHNIYIRNSVCWVSMYTTLYVYNAFSITICSRFFFFTCWRHPVFINWWLHRSSQSLTFILQNDPNKDIVSFSILYILRAKSTGYIVIYRWVLSRVSYFNGPILALSYFLLVLFDTS